MKMSLRKTEKDLESYADRLILNIKALVLLKSSQSELQKIVEKKLLNSHDDDVREFLKLLKNSEKGRSFIVSALGEIVLSCILVFVGVLLIMPVLVDINSVSAFASYLETLATLALSKPVLFPAFLFLDFTLSLVLIASAAALLRRVARELRQAGFEVVEG
jgi:hypothetical protein